MSEPSTPDLPRRYRRARTLNVVLLAAVGFLGLVTIAQAVMLGDSGAARGSASEASAEARAGGDAAGEQGQQSEAGGGALDGIIRADDEDPMAMGDPEAPITLVHWTDTRCPFCAVFSRDTLPDLVQSHVDSGEVRIEFNDVAFFGEDSAAASVAARAAARQDRYFEFLDAVYRAAPESGHPDMPRDKLIGFAKTAGVPDLERFERDLDDPDLRAEVDAATELAQRVGVQSVPFFAVNDAAMAGAQPLESFEQFLDAELAKARG